MKNETELRDYFASKALEGIHTNNEMWRNKCMGRENWTRDKENDTVEDYIAQQSYIMADAMLKERDYGNKRLISHGVTLNEVALCDCFRKEKTNMLSGMYCKKHEIFFSMEHNEEARSK